MKIKIVYYILLLSAIFDVKAQRTMDNAPPFRVIDAVSMGDTKVHITFTLKLEDPEGTSFRKVYFKGYWVSPESVREGERTLLSAIFDRPGKQIRMHSDPRQEVGNQPPLLKKSGDADSGFDLAADEAVLLYEVGGRPYYFRVSGIRKQHGQNY